MQSFLWHTRNESDEDVRGILIYKMLNSEFNPVLTLCMSTASSVAKTHPHSWFHCKSIQCTFFLLNTRIIWWWYLLNLKSQKSRVPSTVAVVLCVHMHIVWGSVCVSPVKSQTYPGDSISFGWTLRYLLWMIMPRH